MCFLPQGSRRADRWSERSAEAGEPTGAREQVCGPDVILTTGVKGAREDARVKIMSVGCPQTAGRASRSGAGHTIELRGDAKTQQMLLHFLYRNLPAEAATLDALMPRFLVSGVFLRPHYAKKFALCLDLSATKKI